eukprot:TRINITY_DN6543_c0_g1_i2.p1 TRINITY_DN6543_c0_g1~~TRINITY_DN6543_c0_g1_i2.p1  ORF type:complete len:434 (+),score=84.41 TRINITY_DN6543_c0_g1_i2:437-1738(+)
MQPGTNKPEESSERQQWNVFNSPPTKEGIITHILYIQKILRRRPFMIKSLENVLRRWVQSLEMYEPEERKRLALLTALCFSQRFTGLAPDVIFTALLNDALVSKGTSLVFITEFFRVYIAETNMDDLVGLLKRGKVDQRLVEFLPSQKQTRWVQSLEMYEPEERKRLALLTALCFSQRFTGLAPDVIFTALLNDALVSKGTSLVFITEFFRVYIAETNMDDLVGLLKRGKVDQRLVEFLPSQKQTPEAFSQHFSNEGLKPLVEYQKKVVFDVKLKELHTALSDMIQEEHVEVADVIDMVKQRKKEGGLADGDVVRTVWDAVMGAVQWSGKNQQQNSNTALRQVKSWAKLFEAVCSSAKMELELLYHIQLQCYEDAKIQRLFPEFVRTLYDLDVLAEDTIMLWFRKGSNPKGRQLFVKSLEPFVKWLEEAEEED